MKPLARILPTLLVALAAQAAMAADFYVSPQGKDDQPGTKERPLASLEAARDAARKAGPGPHRISVLPGDYYLEKTLVLDARDNGLTIEATPPGRAILYGGRRVTGWRQDGERLWSAEVPGVKEGKWDFRALVVNDRLPERARMPETGTFLHQSTFAVSWLSSVAGGWARQPTQEELTTLRYDPKDLPAKLDVRNAELRVYHMWDESLVGLARNDLATHTLHFATPAKSPAGAFGVKKYVVFNTREGMTRPGQWYLDRTAGRVVYWPLPGEDMAKAKVIAPVLERIVGAVGTMKAPVEKIALRGISFQATTTPLKPGGFAAGAYDGALVWDRARDCAAERLEIANVAGQGIVGRAVLNCRITDSQLHHIGACGIKAEGSASQIARNHVHHVGVFHPSAVAISASSRYRTAEDKGFHLYRNEIHDTPYSGIICGGGGHLIEENLISRVMREMQDGGAIYGGIRSSILRGNMVRDVVKMGEGYGVSAYYLDEGAQDCIVERNVSVGVERPSHNHITRNLIIRDNVFIAEEDMTLSFQRSAGCTFSGNLLFVPGKLKISQPSGIKLWTKNVLYRKATDQPQAFAIEDAMPAMPPPARRTTPARAVRVDQPPKLDGEIGWEEWPGPLVALDRNPAREGAAGAPAFAKLACDDNNLYVAINVVAFNAGQIRKGSAWGKDDGAEIALAGPQGVFVIRGFADGTCQSVEVGGLPAAVAAQVGKGIRFAAKTYGKTTGDTKGGWRGEWAIPLASLGLKPGSGAKVPLNLTIFRAEDEVWRCLEGTRAESWRVDQAATLQLK